MSSEPNDWIVVEYVREVLDNVRKRLRTGSVADGAITLTADECLKALACLKKSANGRPRKTPETFTAALQAGSQGVEATLSADECSVLLGRLKNPPFPKGHPPGNDYAFIRLYCFKLEREYEREGNPSVEAAVEATAIVWDCSIATVYAARATRTF